MSELDLLLFVIHHMTEKEKDSFRNGEKLLLLKNLQIVVNLIHSSVFDLYSILKNISV